MYTFPRKKCGDASMAAGEAGHPDEASESEKMTDDEELRTPSLSISITKYTHYQ